MKKLLVALTIAAIVTASCEKPFHGSDDMVTTSSSSGSGSGSGGGTNISASSVPSAVRNAFKTRFPTATRIEWKRLSDGNYKVQFNLGTVRWEAIYKPNGTLVKLERD